MCTYRDERSVVLLAHGNQHGGDDAETQDTSEDDEEAHTGLLGLALPQTVMSTE